MIDQLQSVKCCIAQPCRNGERDASPLYHAKSLEIEKPGALQTPYGDLRILSGWRE